MQYFLWSFQLVRSQVKKHRLCHETFQNENLQFFIDCNMWNFVEFSGSHAGNITVLRVVSLFRLVNSIVGIQTVPVKPNCMSPCCPWNLCIFLYSRLNGYCCRSCISFCPIQVLTQEEQESCLANTKGNARQQCMFEGPLRTKSKLTDPGNWYWVWCIHIRQMAPLSPVAASGWVAECEYFEGGTQVWHLHTENSLNAWGEI